MTSEIDSSRRSGSIGPEADDLVGDLLEHPDALGAGQGEAFLVDDLAEDLFDLAPDLDLVGQVELGVEVLDDPALDPELDVAERLPDRGLGHQRGPTSSAADRRVRPDRAELPGPPALTPGLPPAERSRSSSAVTSLQTPYRPEGDATTDRHDHRNENSDFFCAVLRAHPTPPRRVRPRPPGRAAGCPGRPRPPGSTGRRVRPD